MQDNTDWMNLTSPARSYYQHYLQTLKMKQRVIFIYNWFVVEDERGIYGAWQQKMIGIILLNVWEVISIKFIYKFV